MTTERITQAEQPDSHQDTNAEQIELLYTHAGTSMAASAAAAIILVAIFQSITPMPVLAAWLGSYIAVIGMRWILLRSYFSSPDRRQHPERWHIMFVITLAMIGLLWGLTGLLLVPAGTDAATAIVYSSIAALFASVVATAALASYVVKLSACVTLILTCLLPMSFSFTFFSEDLKRTIGLMITVLLVFLLLLASKLNRTVLGWIKISIEHGDLLKQLEAEHSNVKHVNEELRTELSQRRLMEEELRAEKEKAERLAEQLRALSSRDGLTGIANRRHLDEFITREWNRTLRNQQPLSLVLGDIDYFKNYNDVYGHQKGDHCLKQIAETLNNLSRRSGDLCARYGGEEFAIVLAETEAAAAFQLAESMRMAVEALKIPHCASEASTRVTMSFGVATMTPDQETNVIQLIQMADAALYQAKAGGRNTVASADNGIELPDNGFGSMELNRWDSLIDGELTVDAVREKFNSMGFRCHLQHYEPDTTMGTHASMRDEIHTVIEGELSIRIEDQQYILQPGDYILLPKGLTRRTMVPGNEPVQVVIAFRSDQPPHD